MSKDEFGSSLGKNDSVAQQDCAACCLEECDRHGDDCCNAVGGLTLGQ